MTKRLEKITPAIYNTSSEYVSLLPLVSSNIQEEIKNGFLMSVDNSNGTKIKPLLELTAQEINELLSNRHGVKINSKSIIQSRFRITLADKYTEYKYVIYIPTIMLILLILEGFRIKEVESILYKLAIKQIAQKNYKSENNLYVKPLSENTMNVTISRIRTSSSLNIPTVKKVLSTPNMKAAYIRRAILESANTKYRLQQIKNTLTVPTELGLLDFAIQHFFNLQNLPASINAIHKTTYAFFKKMYGATNSRNEQTHISKYLQQQIKISLNKLQKRKVRKANI